LSIQQAAGADTPRPLVDAARDPEAAAVVDWWIGDPPYDVAWLRARQAVWFGADAAIDAHIREHFADPVQAASQGRLDHWADTAVDWLALLVLLDQFPRNLFRGQAQAFAQDARALALAVDGIERGLDRELPPAVRLFCYLPFEHAEDPRAQERSLALFGQLAAEAPPGCGEILGVWLDYARRHAVPIARFGRFPHRNAAIGRASTAAELDWLARHPEGF
jgi:uncharacterized protein (DUF924 family)